LVVILVPDEFYDEKSEIDKEFNDITTTLNAKGGIDKLTVRAKTL
jgi:hypothetical protein